MFRVIRTADQTPAKEVLEEFLRFIGCMVNDNPITDWQNVAAAVMPKSTEFIIAFNT